VTALRNFDYPEAILFDCDGVLCETERDGHRVTFNMTFKETKGLEHHEWGVEQYGELLKIGGRDRDWLTGSLANRLSSTILTACLRLNSPALSVATSCLSPPM
jgi:phosphoglycolate phosphatase-like HAD superfamily hydrolase